MKTFLPFAALCLTACTRPAPLQQNTPVAFSEVRITDAFWQPRLETHVETTLPACIRQCEQLTHRIDNFAVAAGLKEGSFEGLFYDDSDLYKMLEGASYALANRPDSVLDAKIDGIVSTVAAAQQPDGYLDTYFILERPGARWTDMNLHEMYCCGHLIEAGIAHFDATGKRTLLDVARRFADHICRTFGPGKRGWVPGHQQIELALVKLYRTTGERRYLDMAGWLLDQRGRGRADWQARDYYQDLVPVSELEAISGHAVRAMYLFTGMADYAAAAGDTTCLAALDRLWDDVVFRKMYLTGGIGSSHRNEGFTRPYDLPNREAYCETCASVGMVLWNQRMNMLRGDARYVDVLERAMYNGALAGISLSGERFFYVNPLASDGTHHRQPWYGTACCPSQISRFLPSVGGYVYALSDDALWVNLYVGSRTSVMLSGGRVDVAQQTRYPWDGEVGLTLSPERPSRFALRLRIPGWCGRCRIEVNGEPARYTLDRGYAVLRRRWRAGDRVALRMDMTVEVVEADPRVEANRGRRALQRGPIVYCMEETDNPGFETARLTPRTRFTTAFEAGLLGGVETITAADERGSLKFIPYYAWDNRAAGRMQVWVEYEM